MTTYQDPPPQSRRSARQSERADQDPLLQNPTGSFVSQVPSHQPPVSQPPVSQAPISQPPTNQAPPAAAPTVPPAGRRASRVAEQGLYDVAPEPLTYVTQGHPTGAYPTPVAPSAAVPPAAAGAAQATGESESVDAAYRIRDFSPEASRGRRSATPLIEPGSPSDLDYRTQQVQPPPSAMPQPSDQNLSRREVRERNAVDTATPFIQSMAPQTGYPTQPPGFSAQQPAAPQFTGQQPTAVQFTGQQPTAPQYTGQQPTVAPPGPPASGGRRAAPTAPPPPTNLTSAMAEFDTLTRAGAIPPGGGARVAAPPGYPQGLAQPPLSHQPTGQQPTGQQSTGQPLATRARQSMPLPPEVEQTGGWVAPAGHWSRQADLDDETQPWSGTITRDVGIGHVSTTTSTLIVPNAPKLSDFPAALTSTGEVLLTGSIDLPRSLSATGSDSRHYDDPTVDHMFDSHDGEFTATNSTPVRAVKAVSTHTSARGVIGASAPHGNRMWTVLFASAFVLAVVVVGLFVYVANNGL